MIWALWLWGTAVAAAPHAPPPWAVALPWHVKVRPGALPPASAGKPSVELSAARGECEAFQVLALPPPGPGERLEGVEAWPIALTGPGKPLPLRLYREEFVTVTTPSNSQGVVGLWPDPLVPVQDAYAGETRRALPAPSSAARPLILYAELCVPAGQVPGTYRGELALKARGQPKGRLPITLQVQPFALPATSSLPNTFGIAISTMSRGHGLDPTTPAARALLRRYGTALLAHRLSAFGMGMEGPAVRSEGGAPRFDFTAYDQEMAPFLDGTALPNGARFTTADVREGPRSLTEPERIAYYRAFTTHFAEKGWKAQLFYYAKDEPKPEEVATVLAQSARVRRGGVPVMVTSPPDARATAAADIVCPVINCLFPRGGVATCKRTMTLPALRASLPPTAKVWWYQSCLSHGCDKGPLPEPALEKAFTGWASYMVDHPATLNRAMGPLAFFSGIDGELYWDTLFAYNGKDPWRDVWSFGGNGDGTLFYPGTPDRIGGSQHVPVESLRLKLIREGLEDFEYLTLAAKKDPALARRSVQKLVRSGWEITEDPRVWERVRADLTSALAPIERPGPSPRP